MEFGFDFYMVAVLAVFITGIAKSGFAGGGAMLAVPLMTLFISPQVAAAIMLPILFVIDLFNLWKYRNDISMSLLKILLPGAMIGILIGAMTWRYLDADMLRFGIGLLALYFAGRYFLENRRKSEARKMGPVAGAFMGGLGGLTSFITHAGGPPVNAYVLSQNVDKSVVMATNIYYFFIVNMVKLLPYFLLGQFSAENMTVTLYLAPVVPVGILVGYYLHGLVSQLLFTQIAYGLLVLTGLKLAWDGIVGFL